MAFPVHADTEVVPKPLKKTIECMMRVLKQIAGVSEPKVGTSTSDGWTHPWVGYTAAEGYGGHRQMRFDAQQGDLGGYWFLAMTSGLGSPELKVTNVVVSTWQSQCGVAASVLFP
jgi:hypothetical protein